MCSLLPPPNLQATLHSGVPVASMGMSGPESIGFSIPLLIPHEAKSQGCILPLQSTAGAGEKEWDEGGREDQ